MSLSVQIMYERFRLVLLLNVNITFGLLKINIISILTHSAGRVSLIVLSIEILSDTTILKPYSRTVLSPSASSSLERRTGVPEETKNAIMKK